MSSREYRVHRVPADHAQLALLDALAFAEDVPYPKDGATWWIIRGPGGAPAAFGGLKYWAKDRCGYLCRAGVHPAHRGRGLQQRLIQTRVRYAKAQGWRGVYTYTLPHNVHSGNNLIACGFSLFAPSTPWGGEDACYWWLDLSGSSSPGGGSRT